MSGTPKHSVTGILFALGGAVVLSVNDLAIKALSVGYALHQVILIRAFVGMAIVLAVMVLPTITALAAETLGSLPPELKEASVAMGATRWQTISKVVLPAAIPGIITGIMLSVGRIISETAVFYVTLGGSYRLPKNLFSGGRTLSLHLFYLAMDTNAFEKAMGTGAVLIVSIILINLIIDLISRKLSAGVRLHQ